MTSDRRGEPPDFFERWEVTLHPGRMIISTYANPQTVGKDSVREEFENFPLFPCLLLVVLTFG